MKFTRQLKTSVFAGTAITTFVAAFMAANSVSQEAILLVSIPVLIGAITLAYAVQEND
jgi:hypothetical protein